MKKKIIIIIAVTVLVLLQIIVLKVDNHEKKEESPIGLTCMKIPEGQVVEIVFVEGLYGTKTADDKALFMQSDSRYSGGYVNEKGQLVAVVNQEQAQYWFNICYTRLTNSVKGSETRPVRMMVSEKCDVLSYYVNADTTLQDLFDTAFFWTIPDCLMIQEYAGIPYEEISVKMQVIYEPTGEVMFEFADEEDYHVTGEEWNKKLEEMKKE